MNVCSGTAGTCHCSAEEEKKKASVCREKTEVGLRQWMMPHKAHWDTKVFEADIGFHSL